MPQCSYFKPVAATTNADGTFTIPNFPQGPSSFTVSPPPGTYLREIFKNGKPADSQNLLPAPVEIIYDTRTAHITGQVDGQFNPALPLNLNVYLFTLIVR